MSTKKPVSLFDADVGEKSVGPAGPDMLERDLREIMRMFNPDSTHETGEPGGIGPGNLQPGAFSADILGNITINDALDLVSTGQIAALLGGLAHQLKIITGEGTWIQPPVKNIKTLNTALNDLASLTDVNFEELAKNAIVDDLYLKDGHVANLTVDRILTANILSGLDKLYYIDMQGEKLHFIEATKNSALPQVQHVSANLEPLYWTDETQTAMKKDVTAYPVMVYQYTKVIKLSLEFIQDGTYMVPKITLGAGVGDGLKGKCVLEKDEEGFAFNYYHSKTGEKYSIKLNDDGVFTNPSILTYANASNTDEATATTSGYTTPATSVNGVLSTKIKYDFQLDGTPSAALYVTLAVRINGVVMDSTTRYFSGQTDNMTFNGILPSQPPGEQSIDFKITTSTGTYTIPAKKARYTLTVRNGMTTEAPPYPTGNVTETLILNTSLSDLVMVGLTGPGLEIVNAESSVVESLNLTMSMTDSQEVVLT